MSKRRERPYRKRKRAEAEEETRRRITEAAVELHGSVGPARTTITEVAERAGVSRMTVYNHFPTEADLLAACSAHWGARNPFPDPSSWTDPDPEARLRAALGELYGWYARKQDMLEPVLRDTPLLPALTELMDGFWEDFMDRSVAALVEGWDGALEDLRPALRLAVDFQTWRQLTRSGLPDAEAAALAARMVLGVAVASATR